VPPVTAYSPNAGSFNTLRILLVEDNPDSELALRSALQACRHSVVSAANRPGMR
jgi:CheY-like chemotaxis protein